MSRGEAQYVSAVTAYVGVNYLQVLIYDLKYLCATEYDGDKLNQKPSKINYW